MPGKRKKLVPVALLVALLGIGAYFGGRSALGNMAERHIVEALADRGLSASIGSTSVSLLGRARIRDLCLSDPDETLSRDLICVDSIRVRFTRGGIFGTDIRPTAFDVRGGFIDLSAEGGSVEDILDRVSAAMAGDEDVEDDGGGGGGMRPQSVRIEDVEIRLAGQDLVVEHATLTELEAGFTSSGADIDAQLRLNEAYEDRIRFDGIEFEELPERIAVEIGLDEDDELRAITVTPSERVSVMLGGNRRRVSLSGVGFDAPYTWHVHDLSVEESDESAAFEVAEITLEQGSDTVDLSEFFFASMVMRRPRLRLAVDENGRPIAAATADVNSEEASETAVEPATGLGARLRAELLGRRWWEAAPRSITIEGGHIELTRGGGAGSWERMALQDINGEYTMRFINLQMDVELSAALVTDDEPGGSVELIGVWEYTRSALQLDVEFDRVAPGPVLELAGVDALSLDRGSLSGDVSLRGRPARSIRCIGDLDVSDLLVRSERLQEPLELASAGWEWDAEYVEAPGGANLTWQRSNLNLNAAQLSFAADLQGIDLDARPILDEAVVRIHIPDQEAMTLFNALPDSVLGELRGTEMEGSLGMDLEFPIHARLDDDGAVEVEIEGASSLEIRDETLALVSLPEAVDVRRLNDEMRFVFRGPDNAINRRIRIPAPNLLLDYPTVPAAQGDASLPPSWTRLTDISFYIVGTQLYREDGSFFRNNGINWYQGRKVVAEALATGSMSRGASTISMQLVKNVFLTHERSIERKLRELFLTYWMTRTVPKERILEVYMNVIEWGPGLNGVGEASRHYFGTPPEDVILLQGVWLSAITPNPTEYGRRNRGALTMQNRSQRLMQALFDKGWITSHELAIGQASEPRFGRQRAPLVQQTTAEILSEDVEQSRMQELPPSARTRAMIRGSIQPRGAGPAPRNER